MIVRTWHGCVPVEFGDAFAVHLQATGVQHSQGISGNAGAFVRRETQGGTLLPGNVLAQSGCGHRLCR